MRQRQVLIVEDNYLLLDMLTGLCERRGIGVVSVSSGEAAVATIRQAGSHPRAPELALLITDINLPGLIDGWAVAEAYRTLNPGQPVIYTSTGGRSDRRAVPGSVFLNKPFRIQDVIDLAGAMMQGRLEPQPLLAVG
ncbi:response regulator [Methylobacterium sp.]|jgi:CheY-like chemotaxis protein|uniref:response regulator n=1 Tax=Methylobacterium sp. TaxID=409 RepID=UPI0025FE2032|nr:response regulator [Methylobacterium sp.]MBY0258788.1 response regulator [Methylobacterium sp.]